jgi:hypothetical protein
MVERASFISPHRQLLVVDDGLDENDGTGSRTGQSRGGLGKRPCFDLIDFVDQTVNFAFNQSRKPSCPLSSRLVSRESGDRLSTTATTAQGSAQGYDPTRMTRDGYFIRSLGLCDESAVL